jgi:hypothetical protein
MRRPGANFQGDTRADQFSKSEFEREPFIYAGLRPFFNRFLKNLDQLNAYKLIFKAGLWQGELPAWKM